MELKPRTFDDHIAAKNHISREQCISNQCAHNERISHVRALFLPGRCIYVYTRIISDSIADDFRAWRQSVAQMGRAVVNWNGPRLSFVNDFDSITGRIFHVDDKNIYTPNMRPLSRWEIWTHTQYIYIYICNKTMNAMIYWVLSTARRRTKSKPMSSWVENICFILLVNDQLTQPSRCVWSYEWCWCKNIQSRSRKSHFSERTIRVSLYFFVFSVLMWMELQKRNQCVAHRGQTVQVRARVVQAIKWQVVFHQRSSSHRTHSPSMCGCAGFVIK